MTGEREGDGRRWRRWAGRLRGGTNLEAAAGFAASATVPGGAAWAVAGAPCSV